MDKKQIVHEPLNKWLSTFGYRWRPGQEQIDKSLYTFHEAHDKLHELRAEGAVEYVGHPR